MVVFSSVFFARAIPILLLTTDNLIHAEVSSVQEPTDTVSGNNDFKTKKVTPADPFPHDGYEYPTLYEEADDMLDYSAMMYSIAELRSMAKNYPELFEDPAEILKEQVTMREFDAILETNWDVLKKNATENTLDTLDDALDTIVARQNLDSTGHRAIMEEFNDDNSKRELVYGIFTDHALDRVVVAFRGSTTMMDFKKDAQVWMEHMPNPYHKKGKGQKEKIGIHNGFHDYLLYESTTGVIRDSDGGVKNKYEIILDQVTAILKKNPGYKLYATGHSLGAALSSLFAFLASARDDVPKPVTCISIASPYVGDRRFRRAFRLAEAKGNIRYLRVANNRDIVSIVPFMSFLRLRAYKHVGVQLKLARKKYSLTYPKRNAIFWNPLKRVWTNSLVANLSIKYLKNHGCSEYNARLEVGKKDLEDIFLNDLYGAKEFVGNLMPHESAEL
mmetsp:Transcript_29389/g.43579  ORF Transcript_29389/g.43579 Transcript_29389/m.43579 type:complete len:445 (-) Transcript_29389:314-1648(-)